jgi:hypothetical protein
MTTTHASLNWTAGDDWQIDATLLDENGNPFDLSGSPEIKWALMNAAFQRVLDEGDVNIAVTDPAGKCSIHIPATVTSPLAGGRYSDVIRLAFGGITSTLSYGLIYVAPDPWAVAKVGVVQKSPPVKLRLAK